MQSLKDISSYARYPRFKMHTLYLHLFFIFLLYFLLIGLRSVLFLNVEAVYHDMGPNSFYISMEQEQIEPCNDFIHQLYPDVETSEFVQQNIQIPWYMYSNSDDFYEYEEQHPYSGRIDDIIHTDDVSNFYRQEYYCSLDIFTNLENGAILYDKVAEEIFGYSDERLLSQKFSVRIDPLGFEKAFIEEYPISGVYHLKKVDTIFTTSKYNAGRAILHYTKNYNNYNGTHYVKYTSTHFDSLTEYDKVNRLLSAQHLPLIDDAYIYDSSFHMKTCELINIVIDFSFTFTMFVLATKTIILYLLKFNQEKNLFHIRRLLGETPKHFFFFLFLSMLFVALPFLIFGFSFSLLLKALLEQFTFLLFPSYATYFMHFGIVTAVMIVIFLLLTIFTMLLLKNKKEKEKIS